MPQTAQPRQQPLDQGGERDVEEQQFVLCVVRNVFDLRLEQAWTNRVQDRAEAADREIELEVTVRVPPERRHDAALAHAECLELASLRTRIPRLAQVWRTMVPSIDLETISTEG